MSILNVSQMRQSKFLLRDKDVALDIWNDATSFSSSLEQQDADLIIATDLAAGIACLVLRCRNNSAKIWYDAHEFGSEQAWLKRRPGFTNEIKSIELEIIKNADLFSCVSEELTTIMAQESFRIGDCAVLPNIALSKNSIKDDSAKSQIDHLKEVRKTHKVAMFHGVLSDIRGIDRFIEAFDLASKGEWRLFLMGYFLEEKTSNAIVKSESAYLIDAVDAANVLQVIAEVDAIVMPYDIVDVNTEFCFPNKLGDCLSTHSKFIFNSGLKSISSIALEYSIGASFEMDLGVINIDSLANALETIKVLNPDWAAADRKYSEKSYRDEVLNSLEKLFKY
jgi:glycosyltransferase involved in cell wall biosynthesis